MKRHSIAFGSICFVALMALTPAASPASKAGGSGGGWGAATAISGVNQPDPTRGAQLNDVAVNASGLTIAAWDQYTYNNGGGATIGAAVQSGGRWSAPFTISTETGGYSMNPRVAVGADGTMAVSWTYEDPSTSASTLRRAQVAVKPAGALQWTTTTLAEGPQGGVAIPLFVPVAVDAKGNVTAAWNKWDGAHSVLQTSTRASATGQWSSAKTIADGTTTYSPSVAVNARGDAAIVYAVSACASCYMPYVAQYVSRASGSSTWSAPVNVSEVIPSSVGYVTSPMVALDAQGVATVIYFGYGVEATRQDPGSLTGWTAPQTVIAPPNATSSYGSFDLGVDDSGNAVVAASIFDATIGVDRSSVYVARGFPNGGWVTPLRLTDPSVPVDAYAARVAVSGDGMLAVVGWIDHYHGTVQVAQLSGGTATGGSVWTTTTVGRGTAFSSFQEVLSLDAGSGKVARAVWKNAKSGTQTYASSYNR